MSSGGKWLLLVVFLSVTAGSLAHDVFSVSKVAVVGVFAILGVGLLLSLCLRDRV